MARSWVFLFRFVARRLRNNGSRLDCRKVTGLSNVDRNINDTNDSFSTSSCLATNEYF